MWRALSAHLPFAVVVGAFAVAVACTGEVETNFGPPGGLSGKELPPGETEPVDAAGGKPSDGGGMMKKCMFKGPPDSGSMEAAASEAGLTSEGGAGLAEGGAVAEAGAGGGSEGGTVMDTCAVSWTKDIFPNMTAAGPWQCASASCHGGGGVAGPVLSSDPTASYDALVTYKTKLTTPSLPYILPCAMDPASSALLCNLSGASCGPQMPLTTNGATLLTPKQVTMIKTWIACGALDD